MKPNKLKIFRDTVSKYSLARTYPNGRARLKDTYKLFLFTIDHSGSPYNTYKIKKELWQDWFSHNFAKIYNYIAASNYFDFEEAVIYHGFMGDRLKTRIYLTSKNYNKLRRFRDKFKLHLNILQTGKFDYTNINAKCIDGHCYNVFTTEVNDVSEVKKAGPDIKLFPYHVKILNFFQSSLHNIIKNSFRTTVFESPAINNSFNNHFYFNSNADLENFLMLILLSSDSTVNYECIDHTETPVGSLCDYLHNKTRRISTGL